MAYNWMIDQMEWEDKKYTVSGVVKWDKYSVRYRVQSACYSFYVFSSCLVRV